MILQSSGQIFSRRSLRIPTSCETVLHCSEWWSMLFNMHNKWQPLLFNLTQNSLRKKSEDIWKTGQLALFWRQAWWKIIQGNCGRYGGHLKKRCNYCCMWPIDSISSFKIWEFWGRADLTSGSCTSKLMPVDGRMLDRRVVNNVLRSFCYVAIWIVVSSVAVLSLFVDFVVSSLGILSSVMFCLCLLVVSGCGISSSFSFSFIFTYFSE